MSDKRLLPCPFCGGEARLHNAVFLKIEATVVCKDCGARTLTHSSASFSNANMNAIKAWNTRKPIDRIVERLETDYSQDVGFLKMISVDKAIKIVKEEGLN